ncbi:hypothetical protein Cgig2_027440 [Carnegiea gigantea]|uniref:Uncharacterized protein n=1 Tax=Carnegiea gigantea TaxID=171969 RepID=A0A9Q1JWE4_9CARY|nr:hypothetical protein Cgig2_027440 [Carnegiea gigantea]
MTPPPPGTALPRHPHLRHPLHDPNPSKMPPPRYRHDYPEHDCSILFQDNCLRLLDLGDVVYPCLVRVFYANLETKSTPKGMILMSNVKAIQIILRWQHASDLSSEEATALKVTLPDTPSVPNVVEVLASLKEDNGALWSQLDQIQLDMCLTNKKIDALIRLTSLIHHGAQLAIPFQRIDVAHVAQSAD